MTHPDASRIETGRGPGRSQVAQRLSAAMAIVMALAVAGYAATGVDHAMFNELLGKYVDQDGQVDYRSWKKNDERTLRRYLAQTGGIDVARLTEDERLAYWINIYNALTLQAILEYYPIKSIKDKVSRWGGFNVWDDYAALIRGREYSLNRIEHEVLRPLGEPRIHFAIVCASKGCPRLRSEAYVGDRVEQQLEDNARDFFRRSQNFRVDYGRKAIYISSIIKWFRTDFGKDEYAIRRKLLDWTDDEGIRSALADDSFKVKYLDYDWSLNERKAKQ